MTLIAPWSRPMPSPRNQDPQAPRQLLLTLDSTKLRGLSTEDRASAVRVLAGLLMEAGGLIAEEDGDDGDAR
jgi:hypothetical protein